jgi:hypothetical protein
MPGASSIYDCPSRVRKGGGVKPELHVPEYEKDFF